MAVRTLQKDLAYLGTKCSSAEKVLESIIEAVGLRSSARWAGGASRRGSICTVRSSSCLVVDLEVLKHDVLLSSCLAGSSVAFGRQAAWRAAAFVDELCHQAASVARLNAHETGDFLSPFLSAPHVLYVRVTVNVQGFRCFAHGDNKAMYDDAAVSTRWSMCRWLWS